MSLRLAGKLFHNKAAAFGKHRSPYVLVLARGIASVNVDWDRISLMQESVNIAAEWINNKDMNINTEKSKEMIISYAHGNIGNEVPNILIEGKVVERVDHVKLLGMQFWLHQLAVNNLA